MGLRDGPDCRTSTGPFDVRLDVQITAGADAPVYGGKANRHKKSRHEVPSVAHITQNSDDERAGSRNEVTEALRHTG